MTANQTETILIVDDEEPVRRTFREWLTEAGLACTILPAVKRLLDQIRPAKRARHLHQTLLAFREAVEKILPLVQSAAALQDPVPLPDAVRGLVRFLLQSTGASTGVLLVRSYDPTR